METDSFTETEISLEYFNLKTDDPGEDPLSISIDESEIKIEEENLENSSTELQTDEASDHTFEQGVQALPRIEIQKLPVFKLEPEEEAANFETVYIDSEVTPAPTLDLSKKSSPVVIKPLTLISPSKVVSRPTNNTLTLVSPSKIVSTPSNKPLTLVSPSKIVSSPSSDTLTVESPSSLTLSVENKTATLDKVASKSPVCKDVIKASKNTLTPSIASKCNLCDCYVVKSQLNFHKELHQSVPKLSDRATCTKQDCRAKNYQNYCSLQLHRLKHHEGRELENPILFLKIKESEKPYYVCPVCKAFFTVEVDFLKHCIPYTFFPQLVCNCFECRIIFKSIDELKSHFQKVHKDLDAFKCRICGEGFRYLSGFSAHFEMHYGYKMHCIYCKKDMSVEAYLDEHNHIRQCFARGKHHKCGFCDAIPKKPHKEHPDKLCNIVAHLLFHTSDPPMIYNHLCDLCFNYFRSSSMLTAHKHTMHYLKEGEEKQKNNPKLKATFPCPKCDYLHDSKLQLSDHLTNIEHLPDKKTLKCKICGKTDTKTALMNRHISHLHQDELRQQNPDRYQKINPATLKKSRKKKVDIVDLTEQSAKKKKDNVEPEITKKDATPMNSIKKKEPKSENEITKKDAISVASIKMKESKSENKLTKIDVSSIKRKLNNEIVHFNEELTLEEKFDKMFGTESPKPQEQTQLTLNSITDLSNSKLIELLPGNSNVESQSEEVNYDPKMSAKTPDKHSIDSNRTPLLKTLNPSPYNHVGTPTRKVDESEIPTKKVKSDSDSEVPTKETKLEESDDISVIKIKPSISIEPVVDETSQNTPPPSKKTYKKPESLFKKLMVTKVESNRTKIPICDSKTNKTSFIVVNADKPKNSWNVGMHVVPVEKKIQSKNVTKSQENSNVVENGKSFQKNIEYSTRDTENSQKVSKNTQNGSENSQNGFESPQKATENSLKVSESNKNNWPKTITSDSSDSEEIEVVFASIQIKCEKCNNIFQSKADLSKHSFIHYQTNDLTCVHQCKRINCNQTFINFCSYKLHYRTAHERMPLKNPVLHPKERYQCEICFAFFTSEVTFAFHCFPYTNYWQLMNHCRVCDQSFKKWEDFQVHCEQEHPTETECLQCKLCDLKLASTKELIDHVMTHSPTYKKCGKCQLEFEVNYCDSYHIDTCKKSVK